VRRREAGALLTASGLYPQTPATHCCPTTGQVTGTPVSTQLAGTTGVAVGSPQLSVPTSQALVGVHETAVVESEGQTTHAPARHTLVLDPQAVASGRNAVSLQTGAPLLQSMAAAVAQGFVLVQGAPCTQALHDPLAPLQTPVGAAAGQAVPAGWNV
jgi:hypothetical protein